MKKIAAWGILACLLMTLTACGTQGTEVYVQSVASLKQMEDISGNNRFAGLVVSESVTEIKKDDDKDIEELFVQTGDDVKEGQKLFSYDIEQLVLTLDKQQLEQEQLESSIVQYEQQLEQLEKERERAGSRDKLKYTVQIQTNQIDLKEAQMNLRLKQSEVAKSQRLLENAVVVSPVDGRVTAISESGTDDYGNPLAYITIQKTGAVRVKGTLNEMQGGSIQVGDRIRLESRLDPEQFWMGTVSLVDYDNPVQGNNNNRYMISGSDDMTATTRYPFYVELDDSEGLLLGQHLYMTVDRGEVKLTGVTLNSAFICYDEEGNTYVWADNGQGKLEKRTVELGEYDGSQDIYQILSGLTDADYVAFPDEELCQEGVSTLRPAKKGVTN